MCALLHSMPNFKAAQMNMQYSLIQELILYEFELGHNSAETTKYICCAEAEHTVDQSTIARGFKKFSQVARISTIRQGQVGQNPGFQGCAANYKNNSVSSTWRVSGVLSILQTNVVHHLHNLSKSIQSC